MLKVNLIALFLSSQVFSSDISDIELLFRKNQTAQAKEKIAAYLSKNDSVKAYENIGALYSRLKNWNEAVHYFEIAHNRQSNSAVIKYKLAIAYHQNNNLEKAAEFLRGSIAINPKFLKAVFALADIMEASGSNYEARQVYQAALKKSGENQEIRSKLCVFDFKEAFWRAAVNNCSKAVEKNKKDTTAWALLATSYFELKSRDRAFEEFKEAMEKNKNSAVLHKARGLLFYREKSYEQAAQDLGKAAALDKFDEETVLFLARTLYELERFTDARVAYKEAARLDGTIRFEFQSKQKDLLKKNQINLASDYQESIDKL
ncbi:MAG: tetratricopeptide repeat protein [Oligoflexia bacterium]|nr:tetratricopeptide repeat protein [Oligoflexia bacterium]